jgi:hypothetical protein
VSVLTRYHLTAGDHGHVVTVALDELVGRDLRAVELAGATVTVNVDRADGAALVTDGECTIVANGTRGATVADDDANQVDHTWTEDDSTFTVAGDAESELGTIQWKVTFPGGGVRRFPNEAAQIELHRAV